MRRFFAVAGLVALAVLVAVIARHVAFNGISGEAYRACNCPECDRPAVFQGPDRSERPADWTWFNCDHCRIRILRYDDGRIVTVP
jgi:hypothetical protein